MSIVFSDRANGVPDDSYAISHAGWTRSRPTADDASTVAVASVQFHTKGRPKNEHGGGVAREMRRFLNRLLFGV